MSASIRWALIPLLLMTLGAMSATAQYRGTDFIDITRADGGYPPGSQRADRAFWDHMDRWNK